MCTTVCQAFDRWVAKAGKKRAQRTLDMLRRSHVDPIINQWTLVMVGLSMLRDCDSSRVWETSFIAVNMHPNHRLSWEDFRDKINGFIVASQKFETEVIDLQTLLPQSWLQLPLEKRQGWLKLIADNGETWDTDLLDKLRAADMPLCTLSNIFRIYNMEKKIGDPNTPTVISLDNDFSGSVDGKSSSSPITPTVSTAPVQTPDAPKKKNRRV